MKVCVMLLILSVCIVTGVATAFAAMGQGGFHMGDGIHRGEHPGMGYGMAGKSGSPGSPATEEYIRAMNDMHGPMMRGAMDPDPDAAFARGMLWHHRGAVDMAKIELKYGKDAKMKKLAQDVIDAQGPEIRVMEEWLKQRNLSE